MKLNPTVQRWILVVISLMIMTLANPVNGQSSGAVEKSARNSFVPTFKPSKKTTHPIRKGQAYTFGYLEVLENRQDPNSRTIQLPVYIFKSRSENPQSDPVIYTVGGPGSTSMRAAQYMNYYRYLDDRDLILFEQRGNQYAKPHLDCPEWAQASHLAKLPGFTGDADSLLADAAGRCRERLTGQGIDLNGYTTLEIAADISDLKQALKLDTYNLLTISYSTKIAQVLLRDYPEGIRSVVMDSPLPLEVNYDEESVSNLLESLRKVLSDCAQDTDCNAAYPNLEARFLTFLREKTEDPLIVPVENPETGKMETFYLRGKELVTIFTAASTGDVPELPGEIDRLLNNDLSMVKQQLADLFQEPGTGAGQGMRLSVWCAEEFPFNDQEKVEAETVRYPELRGLSPAVFSAAVCDRWSVAAVPALENEAVTSEVPVLLISGEYDSETPPRWATQMRRNFPNSHHLIFGGWKHGPTTNWGNTCAMEAANAFFNYPELRPGPSCMDTLRTPNFVTENR